PRDSPHNAPGRRTSAGLRRGAAATTAPMVHRECLESASEGEQAATVALGGTDSAGERGTQRVRVGDGKPAVERRGRNGDDLTIVPFESPHLTVASDKVRRLVSLADLESVLLGLLEQPFLLLGLRYVPVPGTAPTGRAVPRVVHGVGGQPERPLLSGDEAVQHVPVIARTPGDFARPAGLLDKMREVGAVRADDVEQAAVLGPIDTPENSPCLGGLSFFRGERRKNRAVHPVRGG